jgi:hypothetical protein
MTKSRNIPALVACVCLNWAGLAHADAVSDWHVLAVQCISTHRPGPPAMLDLALVQLAVHDAVQAIERDYEPYLARPAATGQESPAAAAAAAAYHVLASICPNSLATLDAAYKPYLDGGDPGLAVGAAAAATLLPERRLAFTLPFEPFLGGTGPGEWRPTPLLNQAHQFVFGAFTEPFGLTSPSQFRPGPPPALNSATYLSEYNEVKQIGGVESHPAVAACPAPAQTDLARFWSGNLITIWHDTVRQIAVDQQLSISRNARLLALNAMAMADAFIAVWDTKVHYNLWRPVTAIREGDNDTNDATVGDPDWTPFIQSAHFPAGSQTPAYADYTSGANGVTGASTGILQLFFLTDWLKFEINKATAPSVAICSNPRTFTRLSDAAREVVAGRILLGIHFRAADEQGRKLGNRVALWTFSRYLRPRFGHHPH